MFSVKTCKLYANLYVTFICALLIFDGSSSQLELILAARESLPPLESIVSSNFSVRP